MKRILLIVLLLAYYAVADGNGKRQYVEEKQIEDKEDGQKNRINKIKQFLKSRNLGNLIVEIHPYKMPNNQYLIFTWNKSIKLTMEQKKELIRLHHATYNRKSEYSLLGEMYYEITKYLVYYAIDNQDENLMKSILFDDILHGDGSEASYGETYDETCKLPFYLYYKNIDNYLPTQKSIAKAADVIGGAIYLHNQDGDTKDCTKYYDDFILPDRDGDRKLTYKEFRQLLKKQSPRLAKEVDYRHMMGVLSCNGLIDEDDNFWLGLP
jgi:hypothetical protein